jgi:hypothetical protein
VALVRRIDLLINLNTAMCRCFCSAAWSQRMSPIGTGWCAALSGVGRTTRAKDNLVPSIDKPGKARLFHQRSSQETNLAIRLGWPSSV